MITLYDAFVPGCLQLLGTVRALLDKAEAHCAERAIAAEEIIGAKLLPDMLDFAYQVKSCAIYSAGAIDALRHGRISPDPTVPPRTFEELRELVDGAARTLSALRAEEIEALGDKNVAFGVEGQFRWDFTAKDFLLSFAQPNFYFHATTAYDILRVAGLKIGKLDFLGELRKLPQD